MTAVERPGLIEVQRGRAMMATTLTPSQLDALTRVDTYKPERGNDPDNGYQRLPFRARIAQAAAFYGEGSEKREGRVFEDRRGLMPNPIIANIRPAGNEDDRAEVARSGSELPTGVEVTFYSDADEKRVMHAIEMGGNATANATVLIDDHVVAWLVDGQHRGAAIKQLRARKRLDDDFPVPFKIMLGFGRAEEMKQFFYINSQAKNVPTDLTAELLQRMAQQDSSEAEYLSERKKKGRVLAGTAVYDALKKKGSPWIQRIRRANQRGSKDTPISVSQFISSLTPLQTAQMPVVLNSEDWARIIDAFWEAIARLLPEPFDPTEQPGDWVLLKTTGVNTMHRVLADCLPIVIQRRGRLADPDQYAQLLAKLPSLSGVGIDLRTGQERRFSGADFWRSSSVASQYTGRYGTDRLVGMIRGLIARTTSDVTV